MKSLLLVGCGKMGSAMLSRWQVSPKFSNVQFFVIEPSENFSHDGVTHVKTLEALPESFSPDVVMFAIKPQSFDEVLPHYQKRFGKKPIYISIAAGKTLGSMSLSLGEEAQIIRAMPNTPALIGEGATVLCAPPFVSTETKNVASTLMETIGTVTWIHKESLMDAVTALSGSGPAYVFLFMESLKEAGVEAGLSAEMARMLAIQTVLGSAKLAGENNTSFKTLREQVTSPGGTTEAALAILMEDDALKNLIKEAMTKAAERSCELAGQ